MNKPIHISVIVKGENINTSFYFKDATVEQLSVINSELDILKKEIIDRINDAPRDYEVQDFGEEEDTIFEISKGCGKIEKTIGKKDMKVCGDGWLCDKCSKKSREANK